nr:protein tesmin/TSO1-like CXC 3 isoform X3 [Oryza sativa Japonica Group]
MANNQERPKCSCVQSSCTQLYCRCFRSRYFCSDNCNCSGCYNIKYYEDAIEEISDMIQMKNPNAFDPRIIVSVQDATAADPQSSTSAISDPKNTSDAMPGNEQRKHAKGCSCRKSKCSKLYCECFKIRSVRSIRLEALKNLILLFTRVNGFVLPVFFI